MQRALQLPRTREVIVEFLGTFQRIHEHNYERSRKSARGARVIQYFLTFSNTVSLGLGDDCRLDERFENLSRSELPTPYGFDDLQA